MPTDKDLKKLIRDRMRKTGESYAVARMHVLADAKPTPNGTETIGPSGVGDAPVETPGKAIAGHAIFQIKVTMKEIEPAIWRRLHVPASITLAALHDVIQAAFPWWNHHLHQYVVDGQHYGEPDPEFEDELPPKIDERDVTLRDILGAKEIVYEYDFGDSWEHRIEIESVAVVTDPSVTYPICVGGARSAPHEDCGGVDGYHELVAALADKKHPEHRTMRTWAGRGYHPEKFDLAAINKALAKLARPRRLAARGNQEARP